MDPHCFHRSPPKGWGRIQKVYLDYEKRGVDPKWTLYKRNEVIREFGPWMDFSMLKCIRNIPVKKVWARFVIDRNWRRVKKGTPGPVGLRDCINLCKMLEPAQQVPGFGPKKRHQAAWTYGNFLKGIFSKSSWTTSRTGQPRASRGQTCE